MQILPTLLPYILIAAKVCFAQVPWIPTPRGEDWWIERHNSFVEYSRVNGSNIEILFTGSSVCEYWRREGGPIWDQKYAPMGAVNYGIGGDKIEHCLWRVVNKELENISPKLLVLYCGSNNVPEGLLSTDEIVRGVTTTLLEIANRLPRTKILYVGIMPRQDVLSWYPEVWNRIITINQELTRLHDGEQINFFGMFDHFMESWGRIKSELYLSDQLHFNLDGYRQWDALWNETFYRLIN